MNKLETGVLVIVKKEAHYNIPVLKPAGLIVIVVSLKTGQIFCLHTF